MQYKIINPPSSMPGKYKSFVVDKDKYMKVYSKDFFEFYNSNKNVYNKAVQYSLGILYEIFNADETAKNIFFTYCDYIYITSMDRPYRAGSHQTADKACDLLMYPYFLNPYFHTLYKKFQDKYKYNIYLSLINHHIHFCFSESPVFGFETAVDKNGNVKIPKRPLDNFNTGIETGEYTLQVYTYCQPLASPIMDYYNMGGLVSTFLNDLIGTRAPYDYVKESSYIIDETCKGYGISKDTFFNYLYNIGKYPDMWLYVQKEFKDVAKYIKKKSEIIGGGIAVLVLLFGAYTAYKYIKLFKKEKQ